MPEQSEKGKKILHIVILGTSYTANKRLHLAMRAEPLVQNEPSQMGR